jgi:hypothetical protein
MSERFSRNGFHAGRFKALLLVLIVAVASVAGVYAYIRSLPAQSGPSATITSLPLEFSILLDKGTFQFGENFTIQFLLKNISNKTVTLTKWAPGGVPGYEGILDTETNGVTLYRGDFQFEFTVKASNGTVIYENGPSLWEGEYQIVIEPSGYLKQMLHWSQYYKMDYEAPVPKGMYQLTGQFSSGMSGSQINLETPPVTFTID